MTAAKTNGFQAWGQQTYVNALNKEEKEKLPPLQEKLKAEDDPQRKMSLKAEIDAIRKEFKSKRQKSEHSLFSRS